MLGYVKRADLRLMSFLANRQNPLFRDLMASFSSLGSPINSLLFLAIIAYLDFLLFRELAIGLTVAWITVYGMKFLVSRERPEGSIETGMTSSFPSGHAATAFLFAGILYRSIPQLDMILFPTASLVAFSRVYLQTHYLSDILAGSTIGILLVTLL